ncbi:hypothetical protein D3C75_576880 [compost metagenome]
MHIKQHNHGIFLCGQIIQNGIHHLGEFLIQMIKALGNAGSAGHLLELVPDDLKRLIAGLILQQTGDLNILRDGILYVDITDIDFGQPLDERIC